MVNLYDRTSMIDREKEFEKWYEQYFRTSGFGIFKDNYRTGFNAAADLYEKEIERLKQELI